MLMVLAVKNGKLLINGGWGMGWLGVAVVKIIWIILTELFLNMVASNVLLPSKKKEIERES